MIKKIKVYNAMNLDRRKEKSTANKHPTILRNTQTIPFNSLIDVIREFFS
jgi:hypothetical protein